LLPLSLPPMSCCGSTKRPSCTTCYGTASLPSKLGSTVARSSRRKGNGALKFAPLPMTDNSLDYCSATTAFDYKQVSREVDTHMHASKLQRHEHPSSLAHRLRCEFSDFGRDTETIRLTDEQSAIDTETVRLTNTRVSRDRKQLLAAIRSRKRHTGQAV